METSPAVSVIIPAYNAAKYIARTLASAIGQTYTHFEIIVVDDGSTDATAAIVQHFCERDARVVLIRKENGGVATARNAGIRAARGEFIAPLDADDVWYPEKLQAQVDLLSRCGDSVGLVYCWSKIIDEDDRPIVDITHAFEGDVATELMFSNFLGNGSCALIRRSCFDVVGYYDGTTTPCEEWDMYLRIAERFEVRLVPRILVGYREVLTSLSADFRRMERAFAAFTDALRQRHPSLPRTLTRYSQSYFYLYLTGKSNRQQQYGVTLLYLAKSLVADPLRLLSSEFHLVLLKALFRLITRPVTARLWKDDRGWRNVRRALQRNATTDSSGEVRDATEAERPLTDDKPRRLYDKIHRHRLMRLRAST